MTFNVEVAENRFVFFDKKPNAWQLLLSKSLGIVKDDKVVIVEVDSGGSPTGNNKIGTVVFLNTSGNIDYDSSLSLLYIVKDLGIGFRIIGSTFNVG